MSAHEHPLAPKSWEYQSHHDVIRGLVLAKEAAELEASRARLRICDLEARVARIEAALCEGRP